MGVGDRNNFNKRMKQINRKHAKLAQGYVMSVNHDGLVIAQPRTRRTEFPWRGILFLLIGLMLFKGILLSRIGPEGYEERVAQLAAGTQFEQVGSYVLSADALTVWISEQVATLMTAITAE